MSDLTDFLLARIAEDEAVAREATPGPWVHGDRWRVAGVLSDGQCCHCSLGRESLTWSGRRDINGQRMKAHVHRTNYPWPHGIYSEADPSGPDVVVNDTDEYGYMTDTDAAHIARHNPTRVLAECEAKRRIVELHAVEPDEWGMGYDPDDGGQYGRMTSVCRTCGTADEYGARWPCGTVKALALPYADHPDYRQEWKP